MESELVLHLLAASLVLIGLAGLVLPVLPGAPVIFLGLLLDAAVISSSKLLITNSTSLLVLR